MITGGAHEVEVGTQAQSFRTDQEIRLLNA
jgi:hypothetical protein